MQSRSMRTSGTSGYGTRPSICKNTKTRGGLLVFQPSCEMTRERHRTQVTVHSTPHSLLCVIYGRGGSHYRTIIRIWRATLGGRRESVVVGFEPLVGGRECRWCWKKGMVFVSSKFKRRESPSLLKKYNKVNYMFWKFAFPSAVASALLAPPWILSITSIISNAYLLKS